MKASVLERSSQGCSLWSLTQQTTSYDSDLLVFGWSQHLLERAGVHAWGDWYNLEKAV